VLPGIIIVRPNAPLIFANAGNNFIASGLVVHNSGAIEQDADVVIMLWPVRQAGEDGKLIRYKGDGMIEPLGLTPAETLLAKAMEGDSSDNLPGLIGVGEVTATKVVQEKRAAQFLVEETGMKTRRKTKNNPNPVPEMQDARKVVNDNLAMMDLFHSRIHEKVKALAFEKERAGLRNPETNLTRMTIWLEQKHQFSNESAAQAARQLVSTFRDQWTA
jgi:5'-3' exonuclease